MFPLIIFVLFIIYVAYSLKKGMITRNRAIGSYVMIFLALFVGFLGPIIGIVPTFIIACVNAIWTPTVIMNFLDDLNRKDDSNG